MKYVAVILLLSVASVLASVEPSRYYQTVSNKLVDALYERAADASLSPQELEEAVSIAAASKNGPIVSESQVDAKTNAGIALLKHPGLSATDKCREMVHDIDVVSAYWNQSIPGMKQANSPEVMKEIKEANAQSRIKIDKVKEVLSKLPETNEYSLASSFVKKCCNDDWWAAKRSAIMSDISKSARGQLPQDFSMNILAVLNRDAVIRPMILSYMSALDEHELKQLVDADESSLIFKSIKTAIQSSPAIETEIKFIVSIAVKEYTIKKHSKLSH